MANIVDYLAWRGEFGLEISPWNEVDALLFATLSVGNMLDENVGVKEEGADGDDRDEQEADGARCELAQGRGLVKAFFDGRDFGEEQYGSDYACAEIEYVEIGEVAVKVGVEQLFETKDKTLNGSEQHGRDENGDYSRLEALL